METPGDCKRCNIRQCCVFLYCVIIWFCLLVLYHCKIAYLKPLCTGIAPFHGNSGVTMAFLSRFSLLFCLFICLYVIFLFFSFTSLLTIQTEHFHSIRVFFFSIFCLSVNFIFNFLVKTRLLHSNQLLIFIYLVAYGYFSLYFQN